MSRAEELDLIKKRYLANELPKIKPKWYEDYESIETSIDIKESYRPEFPIHILCLGAEIEKVLEKLHPNYMAIFGYRKMYNPRRYDDRTSSLLDAWLNGIPILPPHLKLNEKYLSIHDGIHRINCALCLGEATIPIIISNHEWVEFGWDLLDAIGNIEMVLPKK